MALSNSKKLEILRKAKNGGYRGNYLDLFKRYEEGGLHNDEMPVVNIPEISISALSNESYNKLSQSERVLYDMYTDPEGATRQTLPIDIGQENRQVGDIHWKDAVRMAQNAPRTQIYNRPNKSVDKDKYQIDKGHPFRAHSDMLSKDIFVPQYENVFGYDTDDTDRRRQGKRMSTVIAEYAHTSPEVTNPRDGFTGRIQTIFDRTKRAIKEGEWPDVSNYQSPGDLEYHTHTAPNSAENQLYDKYNFDRYDLTKPKQKKEGGHNVKYNHGSFSRFFARDYNKYVDKKQDGGSKYTKTRPESGVFISPFAQSFKTSDLQKQQDIQNMDYNFDAFAAGIADVESIGGALMINDQSTATGLYQRLFSEIKDRYPGTRDEFSKDIDAQKRFFKERFDKNIVKDGRELFEEYDPQMNLSKYGLDPVKISALSNMLGRQGTRKYLGSVLRDGKALEYVFPKKYGPNRQLGLDGKPLENKTPEEYIEQFYKVYSERTK